MKSALSLMVATLVLIGGSAEAAVYISCGNGEANDEMSYGANQELQISSSDDAFEGTVGGTWEMKLGQNEAWMRPSNRITAKTVESNGSKNVEITIVRAQTASGPVGTRLLIQDIYSETPSLEKFAVGGFAGGTRLDVYTCVSGND